MKPGRDQPNITEALTLQSERMVRILANGEIVQDDDPRVRKPHNRREEVHVPRQTHGGAQAQNTPQAPHAPRGQGRSAFSDMNQLLVNLGFPRWNLGTQVIEPLMSVGLLLVLAVVGLRGALLLGLLYVVVTRSQQ
ncbi:protein FAM241B-like [Acipenser oxyrinchus oxyrinchus]|uniref:Protein FAM241B-like n=1 Tax=Acipenser oxyrinchus oxyrinchus TaxID=40147 RepID=A0AAD8D8I4_ACIOX|nr:protein FAM241B-like [Acipenser oxyrinchus oxyrinchus]